MKSTFDGKRNEYTVTISQAELEKAFTSANELRKFMHEIVTNTYGEQLANDLFPLRI